MATTASARAAPPASRRSSSISSASGPQTPSSIARGATARSAVSPRVSASLNPPARRPSLKGATPPSVSPNGETRESLSASLKRETEKKEQLLVQLQDKDQAITGLKTENDSLSSSLNAAETRLAELYADQNRMEEEMAARIEVAEKLRSQVRELEKEKRDIQRRYNEQTSTFEAERQAFYDNEQHLKSRIQSLSQARKQPVVIPPSPSLLSVVPSVAESQTEAEDDASQVAVQVKQDMTDPEQEPAEMTGLKLELSTLSTSYNSLQSTLQLLQSQLVDLKRVNNELQEENESYNILLRERTLNGQFDVLKMGGTSISEASSADDDEAETEDRDAESLMSRNTGTSSRLDPVDEIAEEHEQEQEIELDPSFRQESSPEPAQSPVPEQEEESQARNARSRHTRKRSSVSAPRGESLANLPITGPGLDLAAELGRAENKDILEGRTALDNDRSVVNPKGKKSKKAADSNRKVSSASEPGLENSPSDIDLAALRNEVKSLKDANKALSLYASKIIDRIISQEGFEHVLAVDFDKNASPTTPQNQQFTTFDSLPKSPPPSANPSQKRARPQSVFASLTTTSAAPTTPTLPPQERLTTFNSPSTAASSPQTSSPPTAAPSTRASRRSMSFDWKSFSMFGGDKKPDAPANLRPLTLKAGAPPIVTGARKLDNLEDDEDRRERERLNATMKLMGIEKPPSSPIPGSPSMFKSFSSPGQQPSPAPTTATASTPTTATGPPPPSSRFSFFRRSTSTSTNNSDTSSLNNSPRPPASGYNTPNLTQEALERAEAENALAALDAQEKHLSAEMAKGAGGGFTEITRRTGDRRSSRRSGSGSTVWSAGMSRDDD